MKAFSVYQYLAGEPMTARDKVEVGSKFWNKGKWDNFVAPLLPESGKGMNFVDMGCNAGLFLKFAADRGFDRVVGVDSDPEAVKRGLDWRDKQGYHYDIMEQKMEKAIDDLPVADYTVLANAHYYFMINDWVDYLDNLQYKSRYVIIVTAEKRHLNRCWTSAGLDDIRRYFKAWTEVGFVDELPTEGDPMPRRLWGLCFKSPYLDRVPLEKINSSNHAQDKFYEELDSGVDYHKTHYYRVLKKYRENWGVEKLDKWFEGKVRTYKDVKRNWVKKPIIVDPDYKILDGIHRFAMLRNLGRPSVIVRIV